MPKDVDLSSREWCDLVFEGKNKDFGAYELRTTSTQRHNKAVFYTIIGAIIAVAAAISIAKAGRGADRHDRSRGTRRGAARALGATQA